MENDKRLPIKEKTVKKLFAYSGNQCAFRDCQEFLVDDGGTMIGKIAHIRSPKQDGPRYDPSHSSEECRNQDNLLVLCGKHHDIVDDIDRIDDFPVSLLEEYKRTHEARFRKAESALIAKYADMTASTEPTYPKSLRGLAKVLELDEMVNCEEDIEGVTDFVNHLKLLPFHARGFAFQLTKRMRDRGKSALLVTEVESAFGIDTQVLKDILDILDEHSIGGYERDFEDRVVALICSRSPHGGIWNSDCNPFGEIIDYCNATGADPNCFIEDLDFALFDKLPEGE